MSKSIKSFIYKGNVFNFVVLTFASLFLTAGMIILSLMLERLLAIATSKEINELYEQGIIFIILLGSSIVVYLLVTILKPIYQKRAITQYKNNIYSKLLDKNIANFNKENTST